MIRENLTKLKNTKPFLLYIWSLYQLGKGKLNLLLLSDRVAIEKLYKRYAGRSPNLINPETFSEKLQWLKINYHNPTQTICADKFLVREYIFLKGFANILNRMISVVDSVDEIDIKALPSCFVIKATHGSGWNMICNDKSKVSWFWWKKIMKIWLKNNIFWPGREWPYKNMKPRLIIEEYLSDSTGLLIDYKFFCFNGKAKFIQANKGRDTPNHAQNFYDLNWNLLPFGKDLKPRPEIIIKPPACLLEMVNIAETLAVDFPFVRIDFYEVNGGIIFGEFTFYPKSGLPDFIPEEFDLIIGNYLSIENLNREN